ncbi:MAG: hypothetical protein HY682_12205 [Chloroflexi bacterium]|nr:hypothetical protein [Chloroflexota bacterium]
MPGGTPVGAGATSEVADAGCGASVVARPAWAGVADNTGEGPCPVGADRVGDPTGDITTGPVDAASDPPQANGT